MAQPRPLFWAVVAYLLASALTLAIRYAAYLVEALLLIVCARFVLPQLPAFARLARRRRLAVAVTFVAALGLLAGKPGSAYGSASP